MLDDNTVKALLNWDDKPKIIWERFCIKFRKVIVMSIYIHPQKPQKVKLKITFMIYTGYYFVGAAEEM